MRLRHDIAAEHIAWMQSKNMMPWDLPWLPGRQRTIMTWSDAFADLLRLMGHDEIKEAA